MKIDSANQIVIEITTRVCNTLPNSVYPGKMDHSIKSVSNINTKANDKKLIQL